MARPVEPAAMVRPEEPEVLAATERADSVAMALVAMVRAEEPEALGARVAKSKRAALAGSVELAVFRPSKSRTRAVADAA